eukprot:19267-Eustigmatos_ZCMA.PRE.1
MAMRGVRRVEGGARGATKATAAGRATSEARAKVRMVMSVYLGRIELYVGQHWSNARPKQETACLAP